MLWHLGKFLLLGIVFPVRWICSHSVLPNPTGRYIHEKTLDYFDIIFAADAETPLTFVYHSYEHNLTNVLITNSGLLKEFTVIEFKKFARINKMRRIDMPHIDIQTNFTVYTNYLLEYPNKTRWNLDIYPSLNKVVEMAVITKRANKSKHRIPTFFSPTVLNESDIYYWGGFYKSSDCPTRKVIGDRWHSPSKIIGIAVSHLRVWQDFYSRFKNHPDRKSTYIIIFEDDPYCSIYYCGDVALQHVRFTNKDMHFLGWCERANSTYWPPECLHAYAISVHGASVLIQNISPCDGPLDFQTRMLGYNNYMTWGFSQISEGDYIHKRGGLWLQDSWGTNFDA